MASVLLALTTILARSGNEAGSRIVGGGYDGLCLDFPEDFQEVVDLLREGLGMDSVEEIIRGLLGGFTDSWLYRNRPILESLRLMPKTDVSTICIGGTDLERKILADRMSISLLEYRTMAGRISASRWREQIRICSQNVGEAVQRQGKKMLEELESGERWLAVVGLHGRGLESALRSAGHSCESFLLGRPYLGTPLEALSAELAEGAPTDERMEYLVCRHIEFVRDYIMISSDIDEAYDRWLADGAWARLYHEAHG